MKKLLSGILSSALFLTPLTAIADNASDLMHICGFSGFCASHLLGSGASDFRYSNNVFLQFQDAAGTGVIDVLKVDANDETVINSDASDSIVFQQGSDSNRLLTYGASSDAALSITFGDGGTTATQILTISASTADADDDSSLRLVGGGAFGTDGTRGATIVIPGEEVSGGADITYNAGASDTHIFQVAGTTAATIASSGLIVGQASIAADASATTKAYLFGDSSSAPNLAIAEGTADSTGGIVRFLKSRATDGTADTIVAASDILGTISFSGANGSTFDSAVTIVASVSTTPGASADMPGKLVFNISPDSSATPAAVLTLDQDKSATFTGTVTSSRTTDLGWALVDSTDNTACTSICTSAAVFGINLAAGATAPVIVGASDATADVCLCAGAS